MITVRQIERTWSARQYEKLLRDLLFPRPEGSFPLDVNGGRAAAAAAIAMIRLDELSQSCAGVYPQLLRALLAAQEADGGWGDAAVTALCLRALLCGQGQGPAIERGMRYLASLQKADGPWPREPLRRMPADALVSAFILYELGGDAAFNATVRFDDAIVWFEKNARSLDAEARRLWEHAKVRCGPSRRPQHSAVPAWSAADAA